MTTTTATYRITAIPADVLAGLRRRDDAGRPPRLVHDAEGGSPLRCCLTRGRPGETLALVSYAPLRRWARATGADPGPYDETGPVFIHPGPCPGPAGDGVPEAVRGERRVCRAYTADGSIRGGLLVDPLHPEMPPTVEAALDTLFADPDTAVVHVRCVEFGCFVHAAHRHPDA
ncbi:DUF1203 domain-containing protein [Streptomyces capparidis]